MAVLFWFRNDLRLSDNQALTAAAKVTDDLIPLFIFDTTLPLGAAQHWWLHHSLQSLQKKLHAKGIRLLLKKGDPKKILIELIKRYKIDAIYWNRYYEPALAKRDKVLQHDLQFYYVKVHIFNGYLLTNPEEIKNKAGSYFKVFTPYSKHIIKTIIPKKILSIPRKISQKSRIVTESLNDWQLLPRNPDWSEDFKIWQPGEKGAQTTLKKFIKNSLKGYEKNRDNIGVVGTSRLSPYLHFGEISIWQVWNAIKQAGSKKHLTEDANAFLRQLLWREFAYHLLWHFQQLPKKNFKPEFNRFKWKKNKKQLVAWQKGLTGYPIVDAGMRELWHTGHMHNRVRMIVASFLTKDLLIHWREGEKWFWDTLIDADLANNALGWQWVAGSGPDASPFFRVFNPILQGKKFDPEGSYIKNWLPVLEKMPQKYIHHPFDAPEKVLVAADVYLGDNYPIPIVNHATARELALKIYKNLNNTAS